jgi:arsenate reductase
METHDAIRIMAGLAQPSRLEAFRLLVRAGPAGLAAGEIASQLGVAPATLSFHLKEMANAGLVRSRQAGRFVIYSADFERVRALLGFLTENCCGGEPCEIPAVAVTDVSAPALTKSTSVIPLRARKRAGRPINTETTVSKRNVLFLCTGNSARSIFAESILNSIGGQRFGAYSAGSHPAGKVNPFALELIAKHGFPTERLRSKSWDEFAAPAAPRMDFVITVCDKAAGEVCPIWPGQPVTAHWGFEDPAAVQGTDDEKRRVFARVYSEIAHRIRLFLDLPVEKLDRLAIEREVRKIGAA